MAVTRRNIAVVTALIDKNVNVNILDDSKTTALMIAAQSGDLDTVILLLTSTTAAVDMIDESSCNYTALFRAAEGGHVDVCITLLAAGAGTHRNACDESIPWETLFGTLSRLKNRNNKILSGKDQYSFLSLSLPLSLSLSTAVLTPSSYIFCSSSYYVGSVMLCCYLWLPFYALLRFLFPNHLSYILQAGCGYLSPVLVAKYSFFPLVMFLHITYGAMMVYDDGMMTLLFISSFSTYNHKLTSSSPFHSSSPPHVCSVLYIQL